MRGFNSDVDANFTWITNNGSDITDRVSSSKGRNEEYFSALSITSVKQDDYGNYTVIANNGMVKRGTFDLVLVEQGK